MIFCDLFNQRLKDGAKNLIHKSRKGQTDNKACHYREKMQNRLQLFLHMVIIATVEPKKEKTNKQSKKAERKISGIGARMLS